MSSQVKLTLRPPPNVDFIHGYPGIPPGALDRPQASVKGAIEVRVGPQGVKAKWVRIELRKVETLPGGGQTNTYYDFVGPSPINLWTASDEYGILQTQDFPFSIRIPESIPPTITLENRAGIKYELLASVCTKGKKGFLRSRKSIVSSTMAPIIIDKHELHSTWPVYRQHETRQIEQEGVSLMIERNQTCFGPGDRVSVVATLTSDSLHTVILRGFELTLRESTVFRAGPYAAKRTAPQERIAIIGDNKFPVNVTMYGGTQNRAELFCDISPRHTTTTLNAARHIDITYVLVVRALMGTGTHLTMELPVIVSNWQSNVSAEAIRRIGPAPSLSLTPAHPPANRAPTPATPTTIATPVTLRNEVAPGRVPGASLPQSYAGRPTQRSDSGFSRAPSATAYRTVPENGNGHASKPSVDEFGYNGVARKTSTSVRPSPIPNPFESRTSFDGSTMTGTVTGTNTSRRPTSSGSQTRLAVINNHAVDNVPEDPAESSVQTTRPAINGSLSSTKTPWPTAEEEKQRLYEKARAQVERVQGSVAIAASPATETRVATPPHAVAANPTTPPSQTRNTPWPTAEEEKMRLFNQAQAAAKKTQTYVSASINGRSFSGDSFALGAAPTSGTQSIGAAIYSNAMSSRSAGTGQPATTPSPQGSPGVKSPVPHYPSAEQEKAALRRYEEAKRAVDRTQNTGFVEVDEGRIQSTSSISSPTPYESLYPSAPANTQPPPAAGVGNDLPPPFQASATQTPYVSEKERMRLAYEAQDRAARQSPPAAYTAPPPSFPNGGPPVGAQILSEKEILRRKYEAEDAAAAGSSTPQPPPRRANGLPSPRSPPVPPTSPNNSRILTAAEEKALLKAKYEAEARGESPPQVQISGNGAPPAPPPLMPRPPVEYIQETQEEDARVSRMVDDPTPPLDNPSTLKPIPGIDLQPFTPFAAAFTNGIVKLPGPPPPLPPKPSD